MQSDIEELNGLGKLEFLRLGIWRQECTYDTDKKLTKGMSQSIVTAATLTANMVFKKVIML